MRHRLCTVRTALASLLCVVTLATVAVRTALPADPSGFGASTQPAPGLTPAAPPAHGNPQGMPEGASASPRVVASPGTGSHVTTAPIAPIVAADVNDEQIGAAITRGVDFLLSNFDKHDLKHLDGE